MALFVTHSCVLAWSLESRAMMEDYSSSFPVVAALDAPARAGAFGRYVEALASWVASLAQAPAPEG